jgi:hypothetical protein
MKAKLIFASIDSTTNKDGTSQGNAQVIAEIIALAQKEAESVAEDRTERASVASPRADERQGSSNDHDGVQDSIAKEVEAINEEEVDIVEPPTIVRRREPPSPTHPLTVITDYSHEQPPPEEEIGISPLNHDDDVVVNRSELMEDTLDTIYLKIEQCREIMMDPNTPLAEQASAVELMTKMAKVAKIAESLESNNTKKDATRTPNGIVSPLSCHTGAEGGHDDDEPLRLKGSKSAESSLSNHVDELQAKIEQCRKLMMETAAKLEK